MRPLRFGIVYRIQFVKDLHVRGRRLRSLNLVNLWKVKRFHLYGLLRDHIHCLSNLDSFVLQLRIWVWDWHPYQLQAGLMIFGLLALILRELSIFNLLLHQLALHPLLEALIRFKPLFIMMLFILLHLDHLVLVGQ